MTNTGSHTGGSFSFSFERRSRRSGVICFDRVFVFCLPPCILLGHSRSMQWTECCSARTDKSLFICTKFLIAFMCIFLFLKGIWNMLAKMCSDFDLGACDVYLKHVSTYRKHYQQPDEEVWGWGFQQGPVAAGGAWPGTELLQPLPGAGPAVTRDASGTACGNVWQRQLPPQPRGRSMFQTCCSKELDVAVTYNT